MFVDFDVQQFADAQSFDQTKPLNKNRVYSFVKRSFDIFASIVALFCLAPLFLLVACVIKAESPGPVFYRQIRNGKNGSTFSIFKFRSMSHSSSDVFLQCEDNDPRVNVFGHLIRRTSIDELPQLINVLLGQMSIVGPRPHPVELDASYANLIPSYMDRYNVKPGLTGLAQIRGYRGMTPNVETMSQRVNADLDYVKGSSLVGDITIIMRTIPAVFNCRNAL
jgi:lipopolysaccharide/colanic/teichoic acid biosynthesis glycosyltransferase